MDRRTFLIASTGLLLGAHKLPNKPISAYEPVRYLMTPYYMDPYSAVSWLELSDGAWQPMFFEVDDNSHTDRGAVEAYEKALQDKGLNFEHVARTPYQPGQWTVRQREFGSLWYIMSKDRGELVSEDTELTADPSEAPLMSHAEAVHLTLFLLRCEEDPDVFSFYEPVRIDRAMSDLELDDTKFKPLFVDYLPTGYRR